MVELVEFCAGFLQTIGDGVFWKRRTYTDRIKIQGRQRKSLGAVEQWVAVTLQGEGIVFEDIIEPPMEDGSETHATNAGTESQHV
jgi:hypothetical protein